MWPQPGHARKKKDGPFGRVYAALMDRLGTWQLGETEGGGPDVVILAPLDEFPAEPGVTPNPPRKRQRRVEIPDLPEGFEPFVGHSQLLVRTCLIRPESYRPGMRRPVIGNDEAAAKLVRHLAHYDQEHVVTLAIDGQNRLTAIHEAHIGTMSASYAQSRHVLKVALMTAAGGVVMVHNHPSGDPTPSREDAIITGAMEIAGKMLGVPLVDHIVVAQDGYSSFISEATYDWEGRRLRPLPSEILSILEDERKKYRGTFPGDWG